jgi:quinol monooxygenase YgiN
MPYTLAVTWRAKRGEEERVREILESITPLCRAEPACRVYQAHLSIDDPALFFIYEQYDDEAGFRAHTETEHFRRYVLGDAVDRLESRERAVYETLDGR